MKRLSSKNMEWVHHHKPHPVILPGCFGYSGRLGKGNFSPCLLDPVVYVEKNLTKMPEPIILFPKNAFLSICYIPFKKTLVLNTEHNSKYMLSNKNIFEKSPLSIMTDLCNHWSPCRSENIPLWTFYRQFHLNSCPLSEFSDIIQRERSL